ncbi:short-chain dehydrogenase/reductase SDR [Nitzschia inconspicua]|uniref:Short-chain dehydrogenase/reductase SDR n=1 Tax=Nitzschia inconspicua TaxID=303405 RepID=A0A9K3KZD2_9STRA|nr:short-chain dehydrogenase/reductase SDR [Nitzschia inconspicua]
MSKTVLITGGNRGLGLALVECFAAQEDWKVIATARRMDSLPSVADEKLELDLASHESFNPKDQKQTPGYFDSTFYCKDFSAANVNESMMINALHPMEMTGRLMPILTKDATVLAISSWLGSISSKKVPGHYGYAGSKALMNMCIKGLSLEFANDKETTRTAVTINPGWMKTDMGGSNAHITPEQVAERILKMVEDGFIQSANGMFINTDRTEHLW